MIGPVEEVLSVVLGRRSANDTATRLLGLPRGAGVEDIKRKFEALDFKRLCAPAPGGTYCLFQYGDLRPGRYFDAPLLAAMRGYVSKIYDNGDVSLAAFPFAKFFNLGETGATQSVPRRGFIATEKLDGTLIIVWRDPDTGELHYNTRGMLEWFEPTGRGTVRRDRIANPFVRAFLASVDRLGLRDDLETLAREDTTLMFELVGRVTASKMPDNYRIGPGDEAWTPYLLARRIHRDWRIEYAALHFDALGFPHAGAVEARSVDEIVAIVGEWRDREGAVLYYPSEYYAGFNWWNYLVKVKNPVYTLTSLLYTPHGRPNERTILKFILAGAYDDLLAYGGEEVARVAEEIRDAYEELLAEFRLLHAMAQTWDQSKWNMLVHTYKGRWLEPALKAADPDAGLKHLLLAATPRRNIAAQLRRMAMRIAKIRARISGGTAATTTV